MDFIPWRSKYTTKIVFTKADGSTYTWQLAANTTFQKSYRYQYDVTLGKDGVDPVPTVKYMEQPVITAGEKYTI